MPKKNLDYYALQPVAIGQRFYEVGQRIEDALTDDKRAFLLSKGAIGEKLVLESEDAIS